MNVTRKQFIGLVAASAAGAVLAACGGDDDGSSGTPDAAGGGGNCTANGTTVTIGSNHGHVLVVSKEDVTAGADKTYDIKGSSIHTHSVTLSAANFTTLAANGTVMVTSSDAGHTHPITVVCA